MIGDQREDLYNAGGFQSVRESMGSLHRPLAGDGAFKGGLGSPGPIASPAPVPTGWVCPKCGTANAPTVPTCFKCSRP